MNTAKASRIAKWLAGGAAVAAAGYGACVGAAWYRYGRVARPRNADTLLDRFMPLYEVMERHHISLGVPADTAFAVACTVDLGHSPLARSLFKVRELVLGGESPDHENGARSGLLEQMKAIGWGVLAEVPGREIVFGAVTQPWIANPVFRGVPPEQFAAFREPGYVKIAWTLSVEADGPATSRFVTETRATTTDALARARFRRYWSFVWPGVVLIRLVLLSGVKAEAERRVRAGERDITVAGA